MSVPDDESLEQAGEGLAQASESASQRLKTGARLLWVGIVAATTTLILGAIQLGYFTPDISLTGTVNVGWIVEYMLATLAGVIIIGLVATLLIALPGNFIRGTIKAIAALNDEE